jgi:DNA-binding transcriptional LysR family regulator
MLNPVWLNTFITLVDTGHFTKTAEKLFMTQPGVSQHISKLEQACGHSLIRREKKSFELTEQGRLVYEYAEELAKKEHELLDNLAFDDPFSGSYKIACSGSLALTLYPQLLDLQTQHPKLVVQLKAAPNHQILNEIQQGITDIGIVTHNPPDTLFDVQKLGQEQLCLVLPAMVETVNVSVSLLKELGLIQHPDAAHYLTLYFAQNQASDFVDMNINEIPVSGYVNQISQILQPVARGLGFTVLPKSAVDNFQDLNNIKVFQQQKAVMESLYLVKKRNRQLPARFDTVNTTLINTLMKAGKLL